MVSHSVEEGHRQEQASTSHGFLPTAAKRILEMIADGASLTEILTALCLSIDARNPQVISTILLTDPDGRLLWPAAGPRVPSGWTQALSPLRIGPDMGSCGTAAFRRELVVISDVESDSRWSEAPPHQSREVAISFGLRASWSKPLLSKSGDVLGTFALYYGEPRSPDQDDLRLIEDASHLALIAIEVAQSRAALESVISDLKNSEHRLASLYRDLQEREFESRMILNSIPGLVATLTPTGEVAAVTEQVIAYCGQTLEELKQWGTNDTVHPDDLPRVIETFTHSITTGEPYELVHRIRRFDGVYRWFQVRGLPLRDSSATIVRWYVLLTDIEDLKAAEAELGALKDQLHKENLVLRDEVDGTSMFEEIVGTSPALQPVLARVAKVARTDSTVLITGETGTGKELVARAIHRRSARASRVFVSVNCAAVPRELIGSELFGHEKGAFTGATQRRLGRFELAHGGTIFLDEVGELPMETQVALLRALQERAFERVGGSVTVQVDVRVIAATNRDLQTGIETGMFRSDLFYRLNVFPIAVPPLRERVEDIPLLVEYFIDRYGRKAGKTLRRVKKRTLEHLRSYPWPGNVRELQNVIERSVIVCDTDEFMVDESWLSTRPAIENRLALPGSRTAHEKAMIEDALRASGGRVSGPAGAAARLGVPRSTLESRIRALEIKKNRFRT